MSAPHPTLEGTDSVHCLLADLAASAASRPQAPCTSPPQTRAVEPLFALTSRNELVLVGTGLITDPMVLSAPVTRALFAWLDRLSGANLADAVAAPEASNGGAR